MYALKHQKSNCFVVYEYKFGFDTFMGNKNENPFTKLEMSSTVNPNKMKGKEGETGLV